MYCVCVHVLYYACTDTMNINESLEHLMENALADAERARKDINAASAAGKEVVQVLCDANIKRGDIIDITHAEPGEGEEREEDKKVKVIACHEMTGIHPETLEIRSCHYAWCIVLKDGDITTEEEFAALYADDNDNDDETVEELEEAEVEAEVVDPNVCSCGANREMCERNQNVFGGHLNE